MTIIKNSLTISQVEAKTYALVDKTAVVVTREPMALKKSDCLTVKSNFGVVPARENIVHEKKEKGSALTKVIAELTASGLNLASPKIVAAAKTSGAAGKFAGKIMPGVVSGVNVGITIFDGTDSYKKLTNSNVGLPSKALSVATVGLDLVTVFTHHSGYGKAAAMASVVSIGTSIASDYYKNESKTSK